MKLLADTIVPFFSITTAMVFSFLLYMDFSKRIESSKAPEIGTITFKKKTAQRKYTGQVVWEDVEQQALVYDGDSVRTANGSEAVIELRDGSDIELDEESMVLLSMSKEAFDIDFRYGSINAKRKGIDRGDVRTLKIKSDAGEVAIDRSDLSLSKKKLDNSINLSVLSGSASLKTAGNKKVIVNENQRAKVFAGKEADVEKVMLRITGPADGSVIPYNPAGYSFRWNESRAKKVRLRISNDRSMKKLLTDERVAGSGVKKKLQPGRYYAGLSGYDPLSGKRIHSDIVRFSILEDSPVELISPQNRETINGSPARVFFRWSYSESAVEYILELSDSRDFKNIFLTEKTPDNSIMIDLLEKGRYFWRVKKILRGYSALSKTGSFVIRELKDIPPPVLLFPSDRRTFAENAVKKGLFSFLWKGHHLYAKYIFRISDDLSFEKALVRKEIKGRRIEFPVSLKTGKYYWMIDGVGRDKSKKSSKIFSFTVVKTFEISLAGPKDKMVIETEENMKDLGFSWSGSGGQALYRLEVSRRDESKTGMTLVVEQTKAEMKKLIPGSYVWRVSLLDELGASIARSRERSFTIVKRPGPPLLIYPHRNSEVHIGKEKDLVLKWKPVEGAVFYIVSMFQEKPGGRKAVLSEKTKNPLYKMTKYELLDYGRLFWNVRAYTKTENGMISSREAESTFVLSTEKLRPPEIVTPKIHYIRKQ